MLWWSWNIFCPVDQEEEETQAGKTRHATEEAAIRNGHEDQTRSQGDQEVEELRTNRGQATENVPEADLLHGLPKGSEFPIEHPSAAAFRDAHEGFPRIGKDQLLSFGLL